MELGAVSILWVGPLGLGFRAPCKEYAYADIRSVSRGWFRDAGGDERSTDGTDYTRDASLVSDS